MTVAESSRIVSVVEFHGMLDNFVDLSSSDGHMKYWFRGQPTAGLPLRPGVFRPGFLKTGRDADLRMEQRMAQDFRIMSAGIRDGDETDVDLYFLMQHFGMPTRLLDWTASPLAALFFAVCNDPEQDADIFLLDVKAFETTQGTSGQDQSRKFWGVADSRHPVMKYSAKIIWSFLEEIEFHPYIFPVRPDHKERRISLQRSCFTFHAAICPEITKKHNDTIQRFVVPSSAKGRIKHELRVLGINEFSIFGDLEHLAAALKYDYMILAARP